MSRLACPLRICKGRVRVSGADTQESLQILLWLLGRNPHGPSGAFRPPLLLPPKHLMASSDTKPAGACLAPSPASRPKRPLAPFPCRLAVPPADPSEHRSVARPFPALSPWGARASGGQAGALPAAPDATPALYRYCSTLHLLTTVPGNPHTNTWGPRIHAVRKHTEGQRTLLTGAGRLFVPS